MNNKICRGTINFSQKDAGVFLKDLFLGCDPGRDLVLNFEKEFAAYIQREQAIAVSCAKTALRLSLLVLGAKSQDEIIVPAYTVTEVIDVIICQGLKPVFVDISLRDGNIMPESIEQKITNKTKFILMTHMHGHPCDIESILTIGRKYGLSVIEDAAQACGAEYHGRKTGSFGKIAYFSFNMFKNLNTLGGAMLLTDDLRLAREMRELIKGFKPAARTELVIRFFKAVLLAFFTRTFIFTWLVYPVLRCIGKQKDKKLNDKLKVKSLNKQELDRFDRLFSPAQAGLGLRQLKNLEALNQQKIDNAKVLDQRLSKLKQVRIFKHQENIKNIYLNYLIRVDNRQELISAMFKQGIDTSPGFVSACAYVKEFSAYAADCPNSLRLEQENIYLPIYPPLKQQDMLKMARIIEMYYEPKNRI